MANAWTIRSKAALFLACGLLAITAADQASAWGAGGGAGPVQKPEKTSQIDPEKLKKLRDLTKRLRAEMRLDNQKSRAVIDKEAQQTAQITDILDSLPRDSANNPDVREAHAVVDQFASTIPNPKY